MSYPLLRINATRVRDCPPGVQVVSATTVIPPLVLSIRPGLASTSGDLYFTQIPVELDCHVQGKTQEPEGPRSSDRGESSIHTLAGASGRDKACGRRSRDHSSSNSHPGSMLAYRGIAACGCTRCLFLEWRTPTSVAGAGPART